MKFVKLAALLAPILASKRRATLALGGVAILYEIGRAVVLAQFGVALPGTTDLLAVLGSLGLDAGE